MRGGERVLLLGGARAGKSTYALQLAQERTEAEPGRVCFIATAEASDGEMRERITRHRAERPAHWMTIEEPRNLDIAFHQARDAGVVIIDCLTLFVSNWLLAAEHDRACEHDITRIIDHVLATAADSGQTLIIVSNEVGLSLVPDTPLGRAFRDLLGHVNQRVARAATRVYLLVAGLPIQLKPDNPSTSPRGI